PFHSRKEPQRKRKKTDETINITKSEFKETSHRKKSIPSNLQGITFMAHGQNILSVISVGRTDRPTVKLDHVWIKWQHGSPADADISTLGAARLYQYTCIYEAAGHTDEYTLPYIRIPVGIPVHAFLHHHTVTYAAEITEV
ncbi:hypothetical protein ALC56_13473, partial [Trachymyrmex septentrionalis]